LFSATLTSTPPRWTTHRPRCHHPQPQAHPAPELRRCEPRSFQSTQPARRRRGLADTHRDPPAARYNTGANNQCTAARQRPRRCARTPPTCLNRIRITRLRGRSFFFGSSTSIARRSMTFTVESPDKVNFPLAFPNRSWRTTPASALGARQRQRGATKCPHLAPHTLGGLQRDPPLLPRRVPHATLVHEATVWKRVRQQVQCTATPCRPGLCGTACARTGARASDGGLPLLLARENGQQAALLRLRLLGRGLNLRSQVRGHRGATGDTRTCGECWGRGGTRAARCTGAARRGYTRAKLSNSSRTWLNGSSRVPLRSWQEQAQQEEEEEGGEGLCGRIRVGPTGTTVPR